jgi:hypothetical protein
MSLSEMELGCVPCAADKAGSDSDGGEVTVKASDSSLKPWRLSKGRAKKLRKLALKGGIATIALADECVKMSVPVFPRIELNYDEQCKRTVCHLQQSLLPVLNAMCPIPNLRHVPQEGKSWLLKARNMGSIRQGIILCTLLLSA